MILLIKTQNGPVILFYHDFRKLALHSAPLKAQLPKRFWELYKFLNELGLSLESFTINYASGFIINCGTGWK